jgi:hypothetical protein
MSASTQPRVFPIASPRDFAAALANEPVLIDGMKVVFDVKVGLYPVSLRQPGADSQTENEARDGA